jgi:hypothetical protein
LLVLMASFSRLKPVTVHPAHAASGLSPFGSGILENEVETLCFGIPRRAAARDWD